MQILTVLAGYRTYLAHGAHALLAIGSLLTVIATSLGSIGLGTGVMSAAVLLCAAQLANALGGIFQRMATQDLKANLAELPTDFEAVKELVDKLMDAAKAANPEPPVMPDVPSRPVVSSLLILGLVFCGSSAMAAPPNAIIQGPKSAETGEEVILDLSMSEGEPKVYGWRIYPKIPNKKQLTVLEGGKKCRIASFPGTYTVQGLVSNDEAIDVCEWTLTIPGNAPCPAPTPPMPGPSPVPVPGPSPAPSPTPSPTPNPLPTPPAPSPDGLPVGEFDGLPSAVKALALTVNSATRSADAGKLADALDAVAAQLAAGTLKNPIAIVGAIGTAFNGSVPASWDADFRVKAVARMKALYEGGKLATTDRWAVMLREVSLGLRAVK